MTNTLTSPPSTDGLVRTIGDVAAIATEAGLTPRDWRDGRQNVWRGHRVEVRCWPSLAFQVAVYCCTADNDIAWSAIFDYETPATVIAHVIDDAR